MQEERVINSTARATATTLEFLLKALYYSGIMVNDIRKDIKLGNRIFSGETEWNKFMESIDPIKIQNLKHNEVNLDKFKKELEKYGIGFSFYKHNDEKISFAYRVNHKDIVEKVLSETIEKIINDDIGNKAKKSPSDMSLSEKLIYYKEKQNQEINQKEMNLSEKLIHYKEKKDIEIKQKNSNRPLNMSKETSKIKVKHYEK